MLLTQVANAEVTELRYATAAPENTPWGAFIKKTIAEVEKRANGTLKIVPYYSSQLGDEQTAIRQTVRGRIHMSAQSGVATSLVTPEFALLGAPFLFDDAAQSDCVFDKHVRPIFEEKMQSSGLVTLSWVEVGHPLIFSKTPLKAAGDLRKYKIRIPPALGTTFFYESLDAQGGTTRRCRHDSGIEDRQVNAIGTSTVYGIAIGLPKIAPYVLDLPYSHDIGTVTVSKKVWSKLTDLQKSVLRSIDEQVGELRTSIRRAEAGLKAKIAKAGVPVYKPTAAELVGWKAGAPKALEKLVAELGGDAPKIWQAIQDARKACGA